MNADVSQLALFTVTLRIRVVFGVTIMEEVCEWWDGSSQILQFWYL